jgi:protein O-mannosyl-transferase
MAAPTGVTTGEQIGCRYARWAGRFRGRTGFECIRADYAGFGRAGWSKKQAMNDRPIRFPFVVRAEFWLAVALVAVTVVLFWPATGFDYMNLDDKPYVVDNPMLVRGLSWGAVQQAFTTVREQWWLPMLWISYMADIDLFSAGPAGHHLVNILLHAANAGLLFWILFRTTGSRWRSFFVAALFAWHPTRVEAVAWIAARKDVLSGLFFLLGLLVYVRHVERPSAFRMGWVFLLLLLGLMSKAILVAGPFLLLLLDYWPLRRAQTLWGRVAWKEWKPLLLEKAPLFGLAAVFVAINMHTHSMGVETDGAAVPMATRLGLVAPNVFAYLGKICVPIRLNIIYPEHDVVSWPLSIAAILVLLGATTLAFRQREKRPYLLVGWLWFLLALAPVIRGLRLALAQYADRWSYLPLIGLGILLAWAGEEWCRGKWLRRGGLVAGGLILAACLARAHGQLPWWRNSLVMFQRAAYLEPDSHFIRNGLGQALVEAGQVEAGAAQLEQAIRLQPGNPDYLSNRGVALLKLGRAQEALALHEDAIRLRKQDASFHNDRGNALAALGRAEEARAAFEEALRLRPDYADAHYNLGNLLFQMSRPEEALLHFQLAVQGRPGVALIWYNLGITYAQLGRYAEAEPCVQRALALDPELPGAAAALARIRQLRF